MSDTMRSVPDLPGSRAWRDGLERITEAQIQKLVDDVHAIQDIVASRETRPNHRDGPALQRGFHAKGTGLSARLKVRNGVPGNLRVGLFAQAGREFDAIVRFSNAFSVNQSDSKFDQRGLAIRVFLGSDRTSAVQDFLMTNTPVSFGRDAQQFVETSRLLVVHSMPVALALLLARPERFRILRQLFSGLTTPSYAVERYWSRTPFQIGEYAMKYMVQSDASGPTDGLLSRIRNLFKPNYLREDISARSRHGIRFDFRIQLYRDEQRTPIENPSKEWEEADAPFASVAELTIPNPTATATEVEQLNDELEKMAFSPWNTIDFPPLGTMNLARKAVYDESAEKRGGCPLAIGR